MAAQAYYVVTLQVGTPVQEWCGRCLTSAVLAWPVNAVTPAGVSTVGTMRSCTRCDPGVWAHGQLIPWPDDL
jgi:ribosomal protein S27AE